MYGYGYSWNTTPFDSGSSADNEYDYFVVQLPTAGTDLTIGNLGFTESRVPARFVTHTTSDSPLTHENWSGSVTTETSTLVADADVKIANSLVQSETYQYTFGADGTLTIPNDGDLRLTQTQVGWFIGLDSRPSGNDIEGDCIAVDSQGNSYIAGEDQDNDRTFVMKVSPEGDRLWSMNIDEDDNGDDGNTTSLKIHPTTGNIMVVGTRDASGPADMSVAIALVAEMGGGQVVVGDGKVVAEVALPIAGLMSPKPLLEVAAEIDRVVEAARELGITLDAPFMALSFLGLSVIPDLRITDHGLIDVNEFAVVPVSL